MLKKHGVGGGAGKLVLCGLVRGGKTDVWKFLVGRAQLEAEQ